MTIFREGLTHDECVSLSKLYLMADAAHGSSEAVLEVRASDLLRITKIVMRDHKVDWDRTN